MEPEIYHRQCLIKGWEQERLRQARIAIVGSGWLAGCAALYSACLGIGRTYLLDNERAGDEERFYFSLPPGASRALAWGAWLEALGFGHAVIARHTNPIHGPHAVLPPVDAILSATNDPDAQAALARFAAKAALPLVAGVAGLHDGAVAVGCEADGAEPPSRPLVPRQSAGAGQGALPGAILAALMIAEVRRLLLPLPDDAAFPSGTALRYGPAHPERFHWSWDPPPGTEEPVLSAPSSGTGPADVGRRPDGARSVSLPANPRPASLLLVGAGALGTFAALGIATRAEVASLTIVDPDYIEATNLNRQPLYLRAVGDGKAATLAKELQSIRPEMRIEVAAEPVHPDHFDRCQPDLVLSCVDHFAPRKLLHDECRRRGIPLINGGTSAFSGHLEAYHPGKNCCLNCLYALDTLAAREAEEQADPARCAGAPEASIVTTNAAIGALMAAGVGNRQEPMRRIMYYDARLPARVRFGNGRRACACHDVARGIAVDRVESPENTQAVETGTKRGGVLHLVQRADAVRRNGVCLEFRK